MEEKIPLNTYAIINNTDETILKLNSFLKDFFFIKVSFNELETKFRNLFFKKIQSFPNRTTIGNSTIDGEIFESIRDCGFFSFADIFKNNYCIFLTTRLQSFKVVNGNYITNTDSLKTAGAMQLFLKNLILKLRLLKKGDINHSIIFQSYVEEPHFITMLLSKSISNVRHDPMQITDTDTISFSHWSDVEIKENSSIEIAIKSFESSYEIFDLKLRYISLMTALENIFNVSSHQIAHTLSRHLAIIISSDKITFEKNYKRIKHLYGIRNDLVHGSSHELDFEIIYEVQDLVRQALKYVLINKISKNDLFKELNSKGF